MIEARKSRAHQVLLHIYVRWALRRNFQRIDFAGEDAFHDPRNFPMVLFSNHQSWWDAFLKVPLFIRHELEYWVMMEEKNLRPLWWFSRCGAFGVDLETPAGRASGLRYAARLLRNKDAGERRRVLLIYPHGRLASRDEPHPVFQDGLAALLRLCPAASAVPIHVDAYFADKPKPYASVRVGQPVSQALRTDSGALEKRLSDLREA